MAINMKTLIFIGCLLVAFVVLIFVIRSVSYSEPFQNTFVTKVWQTSTEDGKSEVLFPEKCFPRFQKENTIGMACSGGGCRSMTALIGYQRALNRLNLYKNIDYVTSVSGGSWFNAIYLYGQSKGFTIDTLLGKNISPDVMTSDNLDKINFELPYEKNFFMGSVQNKQQTFANFLYALLPANGIPYYKTWSYIIGKTFLEHYGLNENVPLTLNNKFADEINKSNNTNLKILRLKDTDPFWISIGSLMCKSNDPCPLLLIENTPLYSGILQTYEMPNKSKIGGYVVETFAFGCDSPSTKLPYSNLIDRYKEFCLSYPVNVTVNNLENTCFTLSDMISLSSSGYSSTLYKLAEKDPTYNFTYLNPAYRIWYKNPYIASTSDSQCSLNLLKDRCDASDNYDRESCYSYNARCYSLSAPQCNSDNNCAYSALKTSCINNKGSSLYCRYKNFKCTCQTKDRQTYKKKEYRSRLVQIGDGQHIENLGIVSLVARGVKKIICFSNPETKIFDEGANLIKNSCQVDISDLFGIKNDCDTAKLKGRNVQIFNSSDYDIVFKDFRNTFASGGPTFSRRRLNVRQNLLHNVKGGYQVDILFIFLQPSTKFLNSIKNKKLRDGIKKDFLDFKFSKFPNYETIQANLLEGGLELTRVQINLLSSYTDWCIQQPDLQKHVREILSL